MTETLITRRTAAEGRITPDWLKASSDEFSSGFESFGRKTNIVREYIAPKSLTQAMEKCAHH